MLDQRLRLALEGGGLMLPDRGSFAVFHPPADADLAGLPQSRCHLITDFKPHHDAFAARGFAVGTTPEGQYNAALVCLPRSKALARVLIAQAAACCDGPLIIDGQKTDGADSLLRDLRKLGPVQGPISKAHGKLFWIDASAIDLASWHRGPELSPGGFWTAPGVFSEGSVDPASALLVDALPETLSGQVADLGAGWGYLSAHVLARGDVAQVYLVEAGHMALECARRNVTDRRAVFHWADATSWHAPGPMDAVIMNPPFHATRKAEPAIGQAFIAAAAGMLAPGGALLMVANRHLPYEAELNIRFAHVEEIGGDGRFKLFHARRPVRQRLRQNRG